MRRYGREFLKKILWDFTYERALRTRMRRYGRQILKKILCVEKEQCQSFEDALLLHMRQTGVRTPETYLYPNSWVQYHLPPCSYTPMPPEEKPGVRILFLCSGEFIQALTASSGEL